VEVLEPFGSVGLASGSSTPSSDGSKSRRTSKSLKHVLHAEEVIVVPLSEVPSSSFCGRATKPVQRDSQRSASEQDEPRLRRLRR